MKILGIDYGEVRVGVAISDESESVAFPKTVIENSKDLVDSIVSLAKEEGVGEVVVGASYDFSGEENPIMEKIKEFSEEISKKGLKVYLEPEFLTTQEAKRIDESKKGIDARAAAIILQSYLDKKR